MKASDSVQGCGWSVVGLAVFLLVGLGLFSCLFLKQAGDGEAVILHGGGDSAAVFFGDGGGDGQADTETAPLVLVAGQVGPVEAVEQLFTLLLGQGFAHRVGDPQGDVLAIVPDLCFDRAFGGVFHRVVAQGRHQALDGGFVPVHPQALFGGDGHLQAVVFRHGSKGFRGFFQEFARVEGFNLQHRVFLFHAGQVHQFVHQLAHRGGLLLGGADPGVILGLHLQQFHVRGDDRQGGLQFMGGVGDKPLLLLHVPNRRLDCLPGSQFDQRPGQQDAARASNGGNQDQGPDGRQPGLAAEQHHFPAAVARFADPVQVILDPSLRLPFGCGFPDQFLCVVLGHVLHAVHQDPVHIAAVRQVAREPAGFRDHVPHMPGGVEAPGAGGLIVLVVGLVVIGAVGLVVVWTVGWVIVWAACLLGFLFRFQVPQREGFGLGKQIQRIGEFSPYADPVGDIHNAHHQHHGCRQGNDGNAGEAFLKLLDHPFFSRA